MGAEQEQHTDRGRQHDEDLAQRVVAAEAPEHGRDDVRDTDELGRLFEIPGCHVLVYGRLWIAQPRFVERRIDQDQRRDCHDEHRDPPPGHAALLAFGRQRQGDEEDHGRDAGADRSLGQGDVRGVEDEEVSRHHQAEDRHQHDGDEQVLGAHDCNRGYHEQGQQEYGEEHDHGVDSRCFVASTVSPAGRMPDSSAALASA